MVKGNKRKIIENKFLLLSITVLLLSFALINYDRFLISDSRNTQSVLSDSDENKLDEVESSKQDEDEKNGNETTSQNREVLRVENIEGEKKENIKNLKSGSEAIKLEERIEIEDDEEDRDDDEEEKIEDEVEAEIEQESEVALSEGNVNKFKLKIKTKIVAGKTIVETASGEVEVEQDPDHVVNDLVERGLIDEPISFEAKINDKEKIEFEVRGTDSKRFLGIFEVIIPKILTVSSDTGEVVLTNQNVWSRIINFLSV